MSVMLQLEHCNLIMCDKIEAPVELTVINAVLILLHKLAIINAVCQYCLLQK